MSTDTKLKLIKGVILLAKLVGPHPLQRPVGGGLAEAGSGVSGDK